MLCVPSLKRRLAKYLPAISGASARRPAAHKGRVLRVFVHMRLCERCVWQSVRLPGCSQAVSEPALPACCCVCVRGSSAVGHDSKEGFRTCGSELNRRPEGDVRLFPVVCPSSPLSLSTPRSSPAQLIHVCVCMRACSRLQNAATVSAPQINEPV